MAKWVLKCTECGTEKVMDVGYDLSEMEKLYLYCSVCRRNTFHRPLGVRNNVNI